MRTIRKFAIGLSMILTDIVLLSCCLYFTVIIQKVETVEVNLALWIAIGILAFVMNLLLVKKQKPVGMLLFCNIAAMIISCVLVCLTFTGGTAGIPLRVFVCGVLCIVVGHGCYLALMPFKAEQSILFLDALVVVVALFLAGCELRKLTGVLPLQMLCFFTVGYMLIALVFLRTFQEENQVIRGGSVKGKAGIFGALSAIIIFSILLCATLSMRASGAVKSLWEAALYLLLHVKGWMGKLGNILTSFFLRFADNEGSEQALSAVQSGSVSSSEDEWIPVPELPAWLPAVIGIVILAFVAFILIRTILRLRHEKLSDGKPAFQSAEIICEAGENRTPPLWERIRKKIFLLQRKRELKKTPIGLAMLSEKRGKTAGMPMQPSETWHGYVRRLAESGNSEILQQMSALLERHFYSDSLQELSLEEYKKYASALKQLKKQRVKA